MKNLVYASIIFSLFACNNTNENNNVIEIQDFTKQESFYSDFVDNIEIIKLDDSILIADRPTLVADDSSYYVFNRKLSPVSPKTKFDVLLKFDKSGKFQYCIGDNGRGPGEYVFVKNCQIINDTIFVFSSPDLTINKYSKTGEFISKETVPVKTNYQQVYKQDNYYYLYLAGKGFGNWISLYNNEGVVVKQFLPRSPKVGTYAIFDNFFIPYKDEILIREFYSDTIYSINKNRKFLPHLIIDYKVQSNTKYDFLRSNATDEDLINLFKSKFYTMYRFYENDKYIFIEIYYITDIEENDKYYVLKDKKTNQSYWFNFKNDRFLKGSLRYMDDSCFYFMVTPYLLDTVSTAFRSKLKNKKTLINLDPYGNNIIIKMKIK